MVKKLFEIKKENSESVFYEVPILASFETYADMGSIKIENFYLSNIGGDGYGRIYFIEDENLESLKTLGGYPLFFQDFYLIEKTGVFFNNQKVKIFLYDCEKNPKGEQVDVNADHLQIYNHRKSFYFVGQNLKIRYFDQNNVNVRK